MLGFIEAKRVLYHDITVKMQGLLAIINDCEMDSTIQQAHLDKLDELEAIGTGILLCERFPELVNFIDSLIDDDISTFLMQKLSVLTRNKRHLGFFLDADVVLCENVKKVAWQPHLDSLQE